MPNNRGVKIGNEYAQGFGRLYEEIPKAVFAAVAYSYAGWACGEEAKANDEIVARFLEEWRILHDNGIVPQKPPQYKPISLVPHELVKDGD